MNEFMQKFDKNKDGRIELSEVRRYFFLCSDFTFHFSSTKRLTVMLHSYTADTDSNSGLSVLLKDTSTRAGIELPTP